MTKVMNTIPGMGQTSVIDKSFKGKDFASTICQNFFSQVLDGTGGDVDTIIEYLLSVMQKVQSQAKTTTSISNIGILICVVTLMPILNVPVIYFEYIYTSSKTQTWFIKVNCTLKMKIVYDLSYTSVKYNYNPQG